MVDKKNESSSTIGFAKSKFTIKTQITLKDCEKNVSQPILMSYSALILWLQVNWLYECVFILQIVEMLCTIDTYSVLTTSRIEGIEPMANKFQNIYSGVKKKPYDVLDHRKVDFDNDFEDFKKNIFDLQVRNVDLSSRGDK